MDLRSSLKEIYNRALYYLSVPKCLCCKEPLDYGEKALCESCLVEYREEKKRDCSRCSKPVPECTCSNFYLERNRIRKLAKVFRYSPPKHELPGNLLIYSLKDDNRRDTFSFLAEELATSIERAYGVRSNEADYVITNVPRRPSAIRRAGYDHSAALAKRIASLIGVEYCQFLRSKAKHSQKDTHGEERRRNAMFVYRRFDCDPPGRTVILVDDVVTTGASMVACAKLLRKLGVKRVVGATVSVAYKDSAASFRVKKNRIKY